MAVIPFGSHDRRSEKMVIADLNVGILYTFGIVSLGVYGIVLAGYASELEVPLPRRHPLQRADDFRTELAMGMSVVPIFMLVGDLKFSSDHHLPGRARLEHPQAAFVIRHLPDRGVRRDEPPRRSTFRNRRPSSSAATTRNTAR
jgi:NADH-quinone oxidoreductase subunit H